MKIIFLDFDGVIIHHDCCFFFRREGEGMQADPACVRWVDVLCRATGAKIVVSSAHRGPRALTLLRRRLQGWGLKNARRRVVGMTGRFRGDEDARGTEIAEWLRAHPEVEEFVVVDDDPVKREEIRPRLVHVRDGWFTGGFRYSHARAAAKILGGELK